MGREPGENSPWYRSHVLAQRPKLDSETLIPQEWLNLALSDATAAAGLEDLAMHSCPGKMRGLEHQLAILTDVVETPSDASDHGSFPVASAWPKLPDPTTGQIRSSSTDDIACWFIDTDYNGECFFVRHAYFLGADDPYGKLKRALLRRDRRGPMGDPLQHQELPL